MKIISRAIALASLLACLAVAQVPIPGGSGGSGGGSFTVASQAEAEAGTNNTNGMTPLRTKQGIYALISAGPTGIISFDNTTGQIDFVTAALNSTALAPTAYWNLSGGAFRFPDAPLFANLPAAASNTGKVYVITDGNSTCTAGGGSSRCLMTSNGSSWGPFTSGASTAYYPMVETLNACPTSYGSNNPITGGHSWHFPATTANNPNGAGGSYEVYSTSATWGAANGPSACYIRYSTDGTNDQWVFARHTLPPNWVSSQAVTFAYQVAGSTVGTVQLKQSYACSASARSDLWTNPDPSSFTTIEDFSSTVTTARQSFYRSNSVTLSGCSAGDNLWVQYRRTANGTNVPAWLTRSTVVVKGQ